MPEVSELPVVSQQLFYYKKKVALSNRYYILSYTFCPTCLDTVLVPVIRSSMVAPNKAYVAICHTIGTGISFFNSAFFFTCLNMVIRR
jgi:hypothetical protein